MIKKTKLLTAVLLSISLLFIASCSSSDDVEYSEQDLLVEIVEATIPSNPIVTSQPIITKKGDGTIITFTVSAAATDADLKLALTIKLPNANCTVSPKSGDVVDFSAGVVTYTVLNKLNGSTKLYQAACVREKHAGALITSLLIDETKFAKMVLQPVFKDGNYEFMVSSETTDIEVKRLIPLIEVSEKATVSPHSGEAVDFTNPVTFTVTAEDGKTNSYVVTCIREERGEAEMLYMVFAGNTLVETQPNAIKSENVTFYISPKATAANIASLKPTITISTGATVSPASGVAQDFTNPVVYTVTAETGVSKAYTVTCVRNKYKGGQILSMAFEGNALVETQPVITDSDIVFYLYPTTTAADKTSLKPKITISEGATISPASGVAQDFTNPVVYTVTSEEGEPKEYTVTCIRNKHKNTDILSMEFEEVALVEAQPVISGSDIVFYLYPATTPADKTSLTPIITVSDSATISPASEVAQDFTNPVIYTVTAESGATKDYTVTCIRSKYTEAKLISFELNSPLITVAPVLVDGSTDIEFYVSNDATLAQVAALTPVTEISTGATISSSKPHVPGAVVVYTITSEDGQTTITYNVACKWKKILYQFEEWVEKGTGFKWREDPIGWCSSNEGAAAIPTFQGPIYPIARNVDGRSGIGVNILTIETKYSSFMGIPKVTSGSMYLGAFVVDMKNKLNSTKFGIEFHEKPLKVKGYYKYTASTNYWYNNAQAPADTEVDKMSIRAVLYEVDDYTETLTGVDLTTSDKIVAVAYMSDGAEKTGFTEFELVLNYDNTNGRTYDPTKKYKFSIIFASSDRGDMFYGGLGSIMVVDDIEVILE